LSDRFIYALIAAACIVAICAHASRHWCELFHKRHHQHHPRPGYGNWCTYCGRFWDEKPTAPTSFWPDYPED
jgi:hypothetical protein